MNDEDLWTIDQVAEYIGVKPASADTQLRRWEIGPAKRETGRGGKQLYSAEAVREKHQNRPGRGRRSTS